MVSVTIAPLAGQELGGYEALATIPYGLQFLALLATTIPSPLLVARFGRKSVFVAGALVGVFGGFLGAIALRNASWSAFCSAHVLIGVSLGISNLYRFAALELAGTTQRSRAMSLVVFGGVGAAVLGPALSRNAAWFLPLPTFQAAYLAVAALFAASLAIVAITIMPTATHAGRVRWSEAIKIAGSIEIAFGILAGAVGYLFMNMLMVADPLRMSGCGIGFIAISYVIQAHVLAMFLPSILTGRILRLVGAPLVLLGASVLLGCSALMAIYLSGTYAFALSLISLGLSWNAFYLGGSYVVAEASPSHAKYHIQGLNEATVGLFAMVGAMAPGLLLRAGGWNALNYAAIGVAVVMAIAAAWLAARSRVSVKFAEG